MPHTIFLFPGQGAQHVGMGRALHDRSALARELFERGQAMLGIPLATLCFEGPEADLRRTENAQPALFLVSVAAAMVLRQRSWAPDGVAGHSVGEYAALVTAGALTFEDGLRAVRRRGELMAAAAAATPGTMAAIVGLPLEAVEALCTAVSAEGLVEVANDNSPRQIVVSGAVSAVERVMDLAEEREGVAAMPLAVAGAFHSRLMSPAAAELARVLASIPVAPPRIPVVANVTADYVRTPAEIRDALVQQLAGRVRWVESLRRLTTSGAPRIVDVGPGTTLKRLARDILPGAATHDAEAILRDGA